DVLYIRQLYHLPLPKGMSPEDAKTIIAAKDWAFVTTYKPHEIGHAFGRNLLQEITKYFTDASQAATALHFVLFSAHDSTLLSVMSAMGVPLDTPPHYASDL